MTRRSIALAAVLSCTPSPPPAPDVPPAPDIPPAPAVAPAPEIKSAPPDPTPPPATPAPAPPPAIPSAPNDAEFQLAAYRDGDLSVHVLGDTPFVLGAIDIARLDADRLVRDDDDLATQAVPDRDLGDWEILAFGGTSPSDLWLVTQHQHQRTNMRPVIQRREGGRWQRLDNVDRDLFWYYTDIVAYDGRLLGLRMTAIGPDEEELAPTTEQYRSLAGARRQLAGTRPRFDVLGPRPTPSPLKIARDLAPITAAVAPTGELFLLGRRGAVDSESEDYRSGTPFLLRWDPGGKPDGTESKLPIEERCSLLAVRSATEVHVACDDEGALLRHDGETWSKAQVPGDMLASDLAVAPDGALWLVLDPDPYAADGGRGNELWRMLPGAPWERVALPEPSFPDRAHPEWLWNVDDEQFTLSEPDPTDAAKPWSISPTRVVARAGGDVWVTGYVRMFRDGFGDFPTLRDVVLRNRKIAEPLRLRPDGELLLEVLDRRPARRWTPAGCPQDQPAFVTLRTLPQDAPLDQPEPAVEALVRDPTLLAGVTGIFEVHRNGRRTVGLFVRPADRPAAAALLAALARLVPDEPHTLECRQPHLRREFDRTTGRPLQSPVL